MPENNEEFDAARPEDQEDSISVYQAPSATEMGWDMEVTVIDGRHVVTSLTLNPPVGKGITRSMLHGLDLHRIVQVVIQDHQRQRDEEFEWPEDLHVEDSSWPRAMLRAVVPFFDGTDLSGEAKLTVVADVYRTAKLLSVPLHEVAEKLGVHKKTLQRWAQQAEAAGKLTPAERVW